jgi:hypothetical protein
MDLHVSHTLGFFQCVSPCELVLPELKHVLDCPNFSTASCDLCAEQKRNKS